MIISNKQIMQLIAIANGSMQLFLNRGLDEDATAIAQLIDNINNQQSEELKMIEL